MMIFGRKIIAETFLIILAVLVLESRAYSKIQVAVVGVGNLTSYSYAPPSGASSVTAKGTPLTGYGAGFLFPYPLGQKFDLELGALYIIRYYNSVISVGGGSTTISEQYSAIEAPLMLRYFFTRGLSFGLGGYYMNGFGLMTQVNNGTTTKRTLNEADISTTDYGAMAALGLFIPLGSKIRLMTEMRYNYGLKNVSLIEGAKRNYTDIQVLFGLRIGDTKK